MFDAQGGIAPVRVMEGGSYGLMLYLGLEAIPKVKIFLLCCLHLKILSRASREDPKVRMMWGFPKIGDPNIVP